jgi:hypothetical protein
MDESYEAEEAIALPAARNVRSGKPSNQLRVTY